MKIQNWLLNSGPGHFRSRQLIKSKLLNKSFVYLLQRLDVKSTSFRIHYHPFWFQFLFPRYLNCSRRLKFYCWTWKLNVPKMAYAKQIIYCYNNSWSQWMKPEIKLIPFLEIKLHQSNWMSSVCWFSLFLKLRIN